MTEAQIPWLIFIGIIIGSGIGVLLTVIAAIQCGLLPGVKFWRLRMRQWVLCRIGTKGGEMNRVMLTKDEAQAIVDAHEIDATMNNEEEARR